MVLTELAETTQALADKYLDNLDLMISEKIDGMKRLDCRREQILAPLRRTTHDVILS